MEDAKIDAIAREVLTSLKKARADGASAALSSPEPSRPPENRLHPSLQLLSVSGCVDTWCVLEPDKPCCGSLRCRSFGH